MSDETDDYAAREFIRRPVLDGRFLAIAGLWIACLRLISVSAQLGGWGTTVVGGLIGTAVGLGLRAWWHRRMRASTHVGNTLLICLGTAEVGRDGHLLNVRPDRAAIAAGVRPRGTPAYGQVELRRRAIRVRLRPKVRSRYTKKTHRRLADPAVAVATLTSAELVRHTGGTMLIVEDGRGHRYRFDLYCPVELVRTWLHQAGVPARHDIVST